VIFGAPARIARGGNGEGARKATARTVMHRISLANHEPDNHKSLWSDAQSVDDRNRSLNAPGAIKEPPLEPVLTAICISRGGMVLTACRMFRSKYSLHRRRPENCAWLNTLKASRGVQSCGFRSC